MDFFLKKVQVVELVQILNQFDFKQKKRFVTYINSATEFSFSLY